jgi:outer membrane protein TolC
MRAFVLFVCLGLVLPLRGFAQEPPLTLGRALDEAFANNPELRALRLQYEAARALPAGSRYLDAPMLEAQIWEWPVTTLNPANVGMYMFMIEQAYPGRGKRAARALVSERDADIVRREAGVRTSEILNGVRRTFTELALAREMERLYRQQMPVVRDLAEAATLRYAAGHSGQHDSFVSVSELTQLQSDVVTWRERGRVAEATLNALLGRRADAPVEPVLPQMLATVASDAATIALERHPELATANAVVAREEAELARLRGERRPDFALGGGYMLTPGGAGAWTARGAVTWPNAPWSRGKLDTGIDVQQRRLTAAMARRDAVAATIRRGVREAEVRIDAARQRAELIEATIIPHVEHAFDVARVAYAANRGQFQDVIAGYRTLLDARVDLATARAEQEMGLAALELALGDARDDRWPERGSAEGSQP